ncbi:TlpA family protein disulfide reductase [Subsaximicrobium wynnwilliamsii]|uniref:TlpA family protein disulfide reductase n=1 Tax=Subsaximicrobium wynnwilliamsii TaxID=291179 RepID=A0A5C6ZCU3_9FLAO|nr:TlpA disulfide reductase family protein [Subsaximicrobium wynnwilliamsii]TXD81785.1 TlpA family protein disulfide reductase [Subsaximicrobium wynnwilliamsii]TXD87611.1 TlpA family protein disulfide reductase [Subsaximicrobium wynnwilliamsii]TXE01284.1 TlpA family protein disulfide reductase [Subsaximicrobium wynnwilliamsii]
MRYLFLLILVTCVCCKNTQKPEVALTAPIENPVGDALEVYDFEEFESLLHKKDNYTYVINFWATWCAPCIKELPHFEQLNAQYADKNVKVILVSLDFPNQYDFRLKPYISSNGIKSKVVALNDPDSNSWIPKVDKNWTGAIPATLIYNDQKRTFYEQSFDYDQLQTAVKPFLK